MSHGPAGEGMKAEPNLTPMLDMVLQLVMFFMLVANFRKDEANASIHLPTGESPQPISRDSKESDILYINVDEKGRIIIPNMDPKTKDQITGYLEDQYKKKKGEAEKRKERNPNESDEVRTLVVLRCDENIDFGTFHDILEAAETAAGRGADNKPIGGFTNFSLRVKAKVDAK